MKNKTQSKKKLATDQIEELRKRDAMALAQLIYDIYAEKKLADRKSVV